MRLALGCCLVFLSHASSGFAQAAAPVPQAAAVDQPEPPPQPATSAAPTPAIRRWLDVQSVHVATRFRWHENSAGRVTSSTQQWQSQLRGRFLFDGEGRYTIGALASTGGSFPVSWNNTGVGIGTFAHPFNVKQLFLAAEPVKGVQFEAGGLYMNRGELGEHLTYDMDAFIVGERVTFRPPRGRITQIAVTGGHFGEFTEVNVFKRFDGFADQNYAQALVGFALHPRVAASVDYTYEAGRDILREGVTIRMPAPVKTLTQLKFEAYQRMSEADGHGFNAAADLRIQRLSVTAGVMSVDRRYGPFNGDRYETGKRYYSISTYAATREFSVQVFHSKAFDIDFPVAFAHRYEIVLIYNPTTALKRAGVF
jgi:hypothetical protein